MTGDVAEENVGTGCKVECFAGRRSRRQVLRLNLADLRARCFFVHPCTHDDQRIGRRGVFHLFRLPHAIEQDIHALLATEAERQFATLIQSQDQAIKELEEMAEGQDMSAEGPVRISGIAQLTHKNSLRKVAACYCQAFKGDQQTYPYFTVE